MRIRETCERMRMNMRFDDTQSCHLLESSKNGFGINFQWQGKHFKRKRRQRASRKERQTNRLINRFKHTVRKIDRNRLMKLDRKQYMYIYADTQKYIYREREREREREGEGEEEREREREREVRRH